MAVSVSVPVTATVSVPVSVPVTVPVRNGIWNIKHESEHADARPPDRFFERTEAMNVFQRVTDRFGEDAARNAIGVIDWYVDGVYPLVTKGEHEPLSRPKRMAFAEKLLDCLDELSDFELGMDDMIDLLKTIAVNADLKRFDPTIFYATNPRVLGYWLNARLEIDIPLLMDTPYCPVDTYY